MTTTTKRWNGSATTRPTCDSTWRLSTSAILAAEADFRVFSGAAKSGKRVRGINAKGAADRYSRKAIDELTDFVKQDFGAGGLVWFKVDADGKLASPTAKLFQEDLLVQISGANGCRAGRLLDVQR